MPRQTTIALSPGVWTQLTDANASVVVVVNTTYEQLWIMATVGAVAPTTLNGAYPYERLRGDRLVLADMFPGVSGANRLYGFCLGAGIVSVSHA